MKGRRFFFRLCCSGTLLIAPLQAGCSSSDARADQAYSRYQAAVDAGDLVAARTALLEAVQARDDVAQYWQALGRLQLQFGAMNDAQYAFTRAHELDRSNVEVLSALAELSLFGGNLNSAQQYERELDLVAPGVPAALLVSGYLSLRRGELDAAEADADKLLQQLPLDAGAKLLKARILAARGQRDEAIALLEEQAAAKPNDSASLKALMTLLEREDEWSKLAAVAARLAQIETTDSAPALTAIEANFKANDPDAARRLSLQLLTPETPPDRLAAVLNLWSRYWRTETAVQQAWDLAAKAPPTQRLAYATFFNDVGRAREAGQLAGGAPQLPVTLANTARNALFAQALAISGKASAAKRLFDAILTREPDHVYALRGRSELEIAMKDPTAAVEDAQRLITIEPHSADDRLLLVKAFQAAGDDRSADRSLWEAFHELPGDERIYHALRAWVIGRTGPSAAAQVDLEFNRQRDLQFAREFI